MSGTLFSTSWYRISELKPRLRSHAQIHRHHYRGQLWYILQDHVSQRHHRFSPAAYYLIGLMNGDRTMQDIWGSANTFLGDDSPTQDEVIQLLTQLHASDVLQCDVSPDITELLLRHDHQRRQKLQGQLMSPLFWRFPLFDPEPFLKRITPMVRPFFGKVGAFIWLAVVSIAFVLAILHWQDLTENVIDRVLTPQNMLLLWVVFPILKTLHEFGHAFATKAYGGEVHEMGIMLLVLLPLPYVDASAASAFRARWQRIVVGAAGMIVELFLASIALFVWLNIEPGPLRSVAYNIIFISGISSLLFNANPLLRYDGYYMFSDLLEMPNLHTRSSAYITYLFERYLFGLPGVESPEDTRGERIWFVFFFIASFMYRVFVLAAITLFIAGKFFFVGIAFAIGGVVFWGMVPAAKLLAYLTTSPRLRPVRLRTMTLSVFIVIGLIGLIGWMPVPLRSRAEGVIWIPEQAIVRAGTDGFIDRIVTQPGGFVRKGKELIISNDPVLESRIKVIEYRLQELQTRYTMEWLKNPGQAEIIKEEIALQEKSLAHAQERFAKLTTHSQTDGIFVIPNEQDLPGQFVRQGTPVAFVLESSTLTARVVVLQNDIDLVRHRTKGVEIRFADRISEPLSAVIMREVPAATKQLPSLALSRRGGGTIAIDPTNQEGTQAIQTLFQFDLELPPDTGIVNTGGRVYVRFDHGWEPLIHRWHRQVRRLFLSKFHV